MLRLTTSILLLAISTSLVYAGEAELLGARELFARGRYAEALEEAERLANEFPQQSLLLRAEVLAATGKSKAALELLSTKLKRDETNTEIARTLALLVYREEPFGPASPALTALLNREPEDLVGRWLQAESLVANGKQEEAQQAWAWFAEQQAKRKNLSAQEALALAQGLAAHARWSRESRWFTAAVNEVLGEAEKSHPFDWRIPALRAELFAEKHNEPAALDSLSAALAKNSSAAELHALRARFAIEQFDLAAARRHITRAKQINPQLRATLLVQADIAFAELRPNEAAEILTRARGEYLAEGPDVRGRLAAARLAQQTAGEAGSEASTEKSAIAKLAEGDAFDRMRRFSQARDAYREALKLSPELPGVRGKLAQQLLRLDEEAEGTRLLAEANREDPFDVRVKNTMAVLEVLATYATLETEHFIIRFDRGHDELLARYAAEYLEGEVYPALVARFQYAPRGKSKIEIYNRARNTSGHGWFSARMVGLPGLHTIGACSGKVVALASPTDMPQPYNWARVLRHEFVHLMNLEQTHFNVPHWVTEGLAVRAEELPRPGDWVRLITQRYRDGELYTLENINFGFIRPSNSNDWTAAYAQAELTIEYMEQLNAQSVQRLLLAYERNLSTPEAIEAATGITAEEFERGFREHLGELVATWGLTTSTPSQQIERLQREAAAQPENADRVAELAAAYLASGALPQAKKYATTATKLNPKQSTAAFVLATLAARSGETAVAESIAQRAFKPAEPHEGLLLLLAGLKLAEGETVLGEKLLLLGKKQFPALEQWNLHLAKLYAKQKNNEKLEPVLVELAGPQHNDASITARLAELALAREDFAAAERWSKATLQIDIRHAPSHAQLARQHTARKEFPAALAEWEAAVAADEKQEQPAWRLELARLLIQSGQRERATAILEQLVKTSPNLPGLVEAAQELESHSK